MNKNFYNSVVIGSLFIAVFIGWKCGSEPQDTPRAARLKELPISLSSIAFDLDSGISNTISRYQVKDSTLYFSVDQGSPRTLYQLDLPTEQITTYASFDKEAFPFDTEFSHLDFFISDREHDEIWIYDPGRKSFHIFGKTIYLETIKVPMGDLGCTFNNTNTRVGIWSQNTAVHMFTSCYISPESNDFYDLAKTVSRLNMERDRLNSIEYFVPYPDDYHDKVMPINALVDMQAQIANHRLYLNFVASPDILVLSKPDNPKKEKLNVQSSLLNNYKALPPALTGNSYEEMEHHYRQGFYSNFHVWEDGQLLIRFVTTLDIGYKNEFFSTQMERMQQLGPAIRHSIIFFDLKNERVLGEYALTAHQLFPSISFIHHDVLYINQYSTLPEHAEKMIFRGIPLKEMKSFLYE